MCSISTFCRTRFDSVGSLACFCFLQKLKSNKSSSEYSCSATAQGFRVLGICFTLPAKSSFLFCWHHSVDVKLKYFDCHPNPCNSLNRSSVYSHFWPGPLTRSACRIWKRKKSWHSEHRGAARFNGGEIMTLVNGSKEPFLLAYGRQESYYAFKAAASNLKLCSQQVHGWKYYNVKKWKQHLRLLKRSWCNFRKKIRRVRGRRIR